MRKHNWFVRLAVVAVLTAGLSEAAEKMRFDEIPSRLGYTPEHRRFTVVTLDGKRHGGRKLRIEMDQVWVVGPGKAERIASDLIARIEIGRGGRFFHLIGESAMIPIWGATFTESWVTLVLSPVWVYTAASAPVLLIADGIAFLIPPKVYEIVH